MGGNPLQGQLNDIWCFHLFYFTWREITTSGNVVIDARYQAGYTSWNETETTMFAVFTGISMARTSNSLFILNTDAWTWAVQPYQGDLLGAQEDPILTYYSGYLYMVGGIATYNANPYASVFFRYNLSSQKWENIKIQIKYLLFSFTPKEL
ncbi:unnamed protein product [Blepharisma stoltei]|uniref:Uncharacterized protein n=1 Tax=Blepharisma stoltei TaxID=1481888 RepID=A0AAU9K694_9CILI|nr:unnamed protein product [Blepharisma stoltei]